MASVFGGIDWTAWEPQFRAQNALLESQTANAQNLQRLGAKQTDFFTSLLSLNKKDQSAGLGTLNRLLGMGDQSSSSSSSSSGGVPGGYGDLSNQLLGLIDQMGAGRTGQINQAFTDTTNTALSRLSDRGIGGSTFALTAAQGAESRRQQSFNELTGELLGQKVSALSNVGLSGLASADRSQQSQQQFRNSLLSQLLGGLF